jgi:hypothetical protein
VHGAAQGLRAVVAEELDRPGRGRGSAKCQCTLGNIVQVELCHVYSNIKRAENPAMNGRLVWIKQSHVRSPGVRGVVAVQDGAVHGGVDLSALGDAGGDQRAHGRVVQGLERVRLLSDNGMV